MVQDEEETLLEPVGRLQKDASRPRYRAPICYRTTIYYDRVTFTPTQHTRHGHTKSILQTEEES